MECVIGLQLRDFVLLAADTRSSRSIFTMKHDQEKIFKLGSSIMAAVCGESGDTTKFAEYIQQNMQFYEISNGYDLRPDSAANFTRHTLAESLRSRDAYMVNLLLGGYDDVSGPELYYIDYLATLAKVPFAAHGYGSYIALSVFDRDYRPDMTPDEAVALIRKCVQEIQKRLVLNFDRYSVCLISKDGIKNLPDLTNFAPQAVSV